MAAAARVRVRLGLASVCSRFLPVPYVQKDGDIMTWATEQECPQSIGRLSAFMGNAGVLLRAYVYMRMLGAKGMERVSDFAVLNANYLMARLRDAGFDAGLSGATCQP